MVKFPNTEQSDYIEILESINTIKLCLVGQDIYPEDASGIAFCKNNFDQFFKSNCCGKDILYSLGFDELIINNLEFENPSSLFKYLLNNGIAFINMSYELLSAKCEHENLDVIINKYKQYNISFLDKSDKIIILGKTKTYNMFKAYYGDYTIGQVLIHPSGRNRSRKEWKDTYQNDYLNQNYLK